MGEIQAGHEKVSLFELAWTFNHIALASFGGGLSAWSREVLVVEKHWMGEEEFLSAMTMCRILPGANQVNMAVFVGTKLGGIPGALAALIGLTMMPLAFVLAMAYIYFHFDQVRHAMIGERSGRVFQLAGRVNPWFSTGKNATDQFSFLSSIRRCTRRTVSWKNTFVSTMPWQMRRAPFRPLAK